MDGNLNDNATLRARIKELERGMILHILLFDVFVTCYLLVIVYVILVFFCVYACLSVLWPD